MKKPAKKLSLKKETIRSLEAGELQNVAGGSLAYNSGIYAYSIKGPGPISGGCTTQSGYGGGYSY